MMKKFLCCDTVVDITGLTIQVDFDGEFIEFPNCGAPCYLEDIEEVISWED